jgi:hypothetical protein
MRRDDAAAATVITGVTSAASDGADRALNTAGAMIDIHRSGDVRQINTAWVMLMVPAVVLVLLLLAGLSGMAAFMGSCVSYALAALVVLVTSSDDDGSASSD